MVTAQPAEGWFPVMDPELLELVDPAAFECWQRRCGGMLLLHWHACAISNAIEWVWVFELEGHRKHKCSGSRQQPPFEWAEEQARAMQQRQQQP